MRSLRLSTSAPLALSAALLLAGCNAIFGLDAVTQRDPGGGGGSGGESSSSSSSGGSTGSGGPCPSSTVADNLIQNPSFEKNSAWATQGEGVVFDYAPADDCSFACGSRVGHLAIPAGKGVSSMSLYQDVSRKIELGGTLSLSARYRYTATHSPYFEITANGYDVGVSFIHGMLDGEHFTIDALEVPVLDPRRTGTGLRTGLFADYDDAGLDANLDCVSLTYAPPPGAQVLLNGWFDGSASAWNAYNKATLKWDTQGGLCGSGTARVMVAANADSAQIRSVAKGSWPAGTTFRFGSAIKPLPDSNGNLAVLTFTGTLYLAYKDDGDPATGEIVNYQVPAEANSEEWQRILGELTATRPVTDAGLWIGGSSTATPGEFLADCASLRAVPP
jgi:hypothetical protein